ncbi:MAG: ThiF family adenylyltransferase [Planctomycetaceae bacterium]|nr:ThiF family adenylyltransferase [Planctomycetaceae bacterium]
MADISEQEVPERYSRQARFTGLGATGQARLMTGRAVLCGCGALGTVLAETLVRAGIGFLRIVDRDFVEISNLQRQVLFDEADVANQLPKAAAAAQKLSRINSSVVVEPIVADINHHNIRELCAGVDVILDGTDNFETRFLMNDAALELGTPWIYGGCVGSHGQTMTIFPNQTACLRCVIESPPEPGSSETCDTAGVLGPAIQVVASLQAIAAMKLLSGQAELIAPKMTIIDVWDGTFRTVNLAHVRERANCPACVRGERQWLRGDAASLTTVLCGRNAVQVTPAAPAQLDLPAFARRWSDLGRITSNPFLVRLNASAGDWEITLFRDGRAIIKGTDDPTAARTAYAKYVGG